MIVSLMSCCWPKNNHSFAPNSGSNASGASRLMIAIDSARDKLQAVSLSSCVFVPQSSTYVSRRIN